MNDYVYFQKFNLSILFHLFISYIPASNSAVNITTPSEFGAASVMLLEDDNLARYINVFVQTEDFSCTVFQFDTSM